MSRTEFRTRRSWAFPLLAWVAVLAFAVAMGMYARPPEVPVGGFPRVAVPPSLPLLLSFLGVGSVVWYAVFIALPLLLWIARRLDVDHMGRIRIAALTIAAIAALIALTSFVQYAIVYAGAPSRPTFLEYLPLALKQNVLPWVALTGIVIAVESRRRAINLAVDRERMRTQLAEQRLVALTSQLQPHFLFNTLQGISTLIHRDPAAADEMLGKLADLLRDVLRDRERVLVPLGEEMRYARTYLEIAKLRFADRLAYEIDVPADVERGLVPLFILQPLVENALAHGIGARMRGGRIEITGYRKDDRLHLEVADDGEGVTSSADGHGVGLSNTRERLKASFGEAQSFSLETTGGKTVAHIVMPLRLVEGITA